MSLWAIDLLKPFGQGWSRNGHQSFASLHHGLAKDRSAFGWSDLSWLKRMEEPWKKHVGTRTSTNLRPQDHKIRCFSVMQRQISIWIRSSCVSPRALGTSAGKVGIWWNFPIGFAYNISPIAPQVHKVLLTNMCAKESQHFIVPSFQEIWRCFPERSADTANARIAWFVETTLRHHECILQVSWEPSAALPLKLLPLVRKDLSRNISTKWSHSRRVIFGRHHEASWK